MDDSDDLPFLDYSDIYYYDDYDYYTKHPIPLTTTPATTSTTERSKHSNRRYSIERENIESSPTATAMQQYKDFTPKIVKALDADGNEVEYEYYYEYVYEDDLEDEKQTEQSPKKNGATFGNDYYYDDSDTEAPVDSGFVPHWDISTVRTAQKSEAKWRSQRTSTLSTMTTTSLVTQTTTMTTTATTTTTVGSYPYRKTGPLKYDKEDCKDLLCDLEETNYPL